MDSENPSNKPKGQAPVFKDGLFALFLNTREVKNGDRAGETYEVYSAVKGEQGKQPEFRFDINKRVAGYDLTPDEAAALAFGDEIVIDRQSKNTRVDPETGEEIPKTYTQIFGPLPKVDRQVGDKVFTTLPIGYGFAHFSKPDEASGEPPELISVTVNALKPDGKEDREGSGLETYRFIGPKTNSVKVTIADIYAARLALSQGKPFAIERDGVTVPLVGTAPSKRDNGPARFEWGRAVFSSQSHAPSAKPRNATVV